MWLHERCSQCLNCLGFGDVLCRPSYHGRHCGGQLGQFRVQPEAVYSTPPSATTADAAMTYPMPPSLSTTGAKRGHGDWEPSFAAIETDSPAHWRVDLRPGTRLLNLEWVPITFNPIRWIYGSLRLHNHHLVSHLSPFEKDGLVHVALH